MKAVAKSELTPEAQIERAKRQLVDSVDALVDAKIAALGANSEWIDQNHSPIGRRLHLELARAGKLPSKKMKKLVLVLRADLNAFIEREGLSRGKREEDEDVSDVVDAITKGGRRR